MTTKVTLLGNSTRPGNHLWDEYKDEYGRSTLSVHTPRTIMESCPKCYFVEVDTIGNVQCRRCGRGQRIVRGMHELYRGQIRKVRVK